MKIAIRYYTRSGNTKKLAEAISAAVGVEALPVSAPLEERVDVLFLGSSYYAFDIDEAIKSFILNNSDRIGRIVCFGTSAMMKSTHKPMQKVAAAAGVPLAEEEFHCRGSFGIANKGRPNADDLKKVAEFAKKMVQ